MSGGRGAMVRSEKWTGFSREAAVWLCFSLCGYKYGALNVAFVQSFIVRHRKIVCRIGDHGQGRAAEPSRFICSGGLRYSSSKFVPVNYGTSANAGVYTDRQLGTAVSSR